MIFAKIIVISCVLTLALAAYDQTTAERVYNYSKISYCAQPYIQSWDCGIDCQNFPGMSSIQVFFNALRQAQGYTGYDPNSNMIVAAIRGTADVTDWVDDFQAALVSYTSNGCSDCTIHQGFYDTYLEISAGMLSEIQSLVAIYPSAQVVVTGHSLGGAMATHLAIDVYYTVGVTNAIFYTFGSPRVGNQAFAFFVDSVYPDAYRVVHY